MILGCEVCFGTMEIVAACLASLPIVGGTLACWWRRVRRRRKATAPA